MDDVFDGRDAGDGIFGEDAKLQGKSTGEFTVEIDGAAAHTGDHAGALDLGALELNEDDGLARAEEIGHYADNFEIEPFDLIARENCVGVTLHAGTDLIEGKDLIRLGCGGDWEKQREEQREAEDSAKANR
jgi:hypothetical protein